MYCQSTMEYPIAHGAPDGEGGVLMKTPVPDSTRETEERR